MGSDVDALEELRNAFAAAILSLQHHSIVVNLKAIEDAADKYDLVCSINSSGDRTFRVVPKSSWLSERGGTVDD